MKKYIKKILFVLFGIACLTGYASANEVRGNMYFSQETLEHGMASSIGFQSAEPGMVYAGLNLNYISTSTPIQFDGRTTIVPIYFFAGIKAPWTVAPYVEAGMDFFEMLFDGMSNSHEHAESPNEIDYYVAAGVKYSISSDMSVSFYAKRYEFRFRDGWFMPLNKASHSGYGVTLSVQF
ncbi:MAG: hypothetical protein HUJ30_05680 [Gammaproteobacteria bacterium]|nr:hypothetical protein [Gammaproteobacteria bacterium]